MMMLVASSWVGRAIAACAVSFGTAAVPMDQDAGKGVHGAKVFNLDRFVPTGVEQKIQFIADVDPACDPLSPITARVIIKPMHGTLQTVDADDYGFWSAPNTREKCNSTKVKGLRISYKSEPDFTGEDRATVLIITPDSQALQYQFVINVL